MVPFMNKFDKDTFKNQRVLYIATKNIDYIRIAQEIRLLQESCQKVEVIGYTNKSYLVRLLKIYYKLIFLSVNEYDFVFVGFLAQLIIPLFHTKFKNNKLYVDFFVSIYDTLVFDRKKIREKSIMAFFCEWIDKKTLDMADIVVCDTVAHRNYFINQFEQQRNKFEILYLEADKTIYYPMQKCKPLKWRNKYIVLYFGSILPLQGVDVVLEAIGLLKWDENIHFLIIGPIGHKYKRIESDTVTYIEWLSQKELAEYIAFSDLCLAGHFCAKIDKANRTIPGKAYIYQTMGKKMILGDSDANKEFFGKDYTFVERGNAEALARQIREEREKNEESSVDIFTCPI